MMRVYVPQVLIHRQKTEPGVIGFGDRASGPMLEHIADLELFGIASEWHGEVVRVCVNALFSLVTPIWLCQC
jgi:hypothetical protein